jgi:hypothetical protein
MFGLSGNSVGALIALPPILLGLSPEVPVMSVEIAILARKVRWTSITLGLERRAAEIEEPRLGAGKNEGD